jgi:hypothetical protein
LKRTVKHQTPKNNSSREMEVPHNRRQENKRARMAEKYGAVTVLLEEEIEEDEEEYDRDDEPAT